MTKNRDLLLQIADGYESIARILYDIANNRKIPKEVIKQVYVLWVKDELVAALQSSGYLEQ